MYQQNNQFNATLQNIKNAKQQGKNPQAIMNAMLQSNPQMRQQLTQLQNMAQGRNPKDFIMQLAKQNGADEFALGIIAELFDN